MPVTYSPRRRYSDDLPYLESDRDYLDNNSALAVRLLDDWAKRNGHKTEENIENGA